MNKKEDVWIHTSCDQCLGECGIMVRRVDGIVREIKGDPECPNSNGKICGKGQSAIMRLYDPNRVLQPMKRTNPKKGLGIDPGWEVISWEEALETLTKKLVEVRKKDPRKLVFSTFDTYALCHWLPSWTQAFGTPNIWIVYFCGQYLHSSMYITNGTFHCDFDAKYCKYLLLVGNQSGFGAGLGPNISVQAVAEARKKGMKVVVIDPVCNQAGSKADEWVPVLPGTDAALMLSMANVMVNELKVYDIDFMKKYTNAPYLVQKDGTYLRMNEKPLMWDPVDVMAKPYDADFKDYALEGTYDVDGVSTTTAFDILKAHLKQYTPESVTKITTVSPATIRRITKEFSEAASIGTTITIEGVAFPYRPVAVNIYRGAGAHKHGVAVALATQLLNQLAGALYVPGSHRGINPVGPRPNRDAPPGFDIMPNWGWNFDSYEGLVSPTPGLPRAPNYYHYVAKRPETVMLRELFPLSSTRAAHAVLTSANPEKYKLDYQPEVLINCRRNPFAGGFDYKVTAEAFKAYKYIAVFATHFDKLSDFADLLLPEAVGMEKLEAFPNLLNWGHNGQSAQWYWGIKQPVIDKPMGEARDWRDVMMEVADRMGILEYVYDKFNTSNSISHHFSDRYKLDVKKKYTPEELCDRRFKSQFGEEKGLEWFKKNGYLKWTRNIDEQFPLPWLKVRFPIYHELYVRAGRDMEKLVKEIDLKDWDLEDYVPLPTWKPCDSYDRRGTHDLIAINFRVPTHAQSHTANNAWLNEVAELNPYTQKIMISPEAAANNGIEDGDTIWVESKVDRAQGIVKVTECIHPEVVGISSHFGTIAKGKPIAYGKGVQFNRLLPGDMDPVSTGVDACVRVKIYKAG
ncbi:molybdopterin-dependent oxidoreductase [Desulfobacula sp.]|uniref:molybdopterin-dependent oxidoreductase n=1 Tax=Desulfobacula sp. TaxID=2593537 RepID=UPI002627544A|nr:molybdopterin-dependent oxidoreductase [Desulfobacula sp.]